MSELTDAAECLSLRSLRERTKDTKKFIDDEAGDDDEEKKGEEEKPQSKRPPRLANKRKDGRVLTPKDQFFTPTIAVAMLFNFLERQFLMATNSKHFV